MGVNRERGSMMCDRHHYGIIRTLSERDRRERELSVSYT